MKTRIFVVILSLTLSISLPISAKDTPKAVVKADTKNVDDVKTFDFEKIFAEAEKYFKAAESWKKMRGETKAWKVYHRCMILGMCTTITSINKD